MSVVIQHSADSVVPYVIPLDLAAEIDFISFPGWFWCKISKNSGGEFSDPYNPLFKGVKGYH